MNEIKAIGIEDLYELRKKLEEIIDSRILPNLARDINGAEGKFRRTVVAFQGIVYDVLDLVQSQIIAQLEVENEGKVSESEVVQ